MDEIEDDLIADLESTDLINSPLPSNSGISEEDQQRIDEEANSVAYLDYFGGQDRGIADPIKVGQYGIGDSQFDTGIIYDELGSLDERRAQLQPWTDQLANAVTQIAIGEIVGGSIKGVGYLLELGNVVDYLTGKEVEWGNFITDIGETIHEGTEEGMRIYEKAPGTVNLWDSGYWFKNSVSIGSTVSMMLPSMAATKILGMVGKSVSKGLAALTKTKSIAEKMSKSAIWMTKGLSQAVISRHIENSLESKGTFDSTYEEVINEINEKTGIKFTENEAKMIAAEAASNNYRNGWAMLLQDIPQYLAIGRVFNPIAMKFESAVGKAALSKINPFVKKAASIIGVFGSEAAEESYQYYISQKAQNLSKLNAGIITQKQFDENMREILGDDEMITSALFGGLGGSVFQMVGPKANRLFEGKTKREVRKISEESYKENLTSRAKVFASTQLDLDDADNSASRFNRDRVLHASMSQMVTDALERDKYDQVIETLENLSNMSPEEIAEFEKESGTEFSKELLDSHMPNIKELAEKIKKDYLKYRNNISEPAIAARMANIDHYARELDSLKETSTKEADEAMDTIKIKGSAFILDIKRKELEIAALKLFIDRTQQQFNAEQDEDVRKDLMSSILTNEEELKFQEESVKSLRKNDTRTKSEKKKDTKFVRSYSSGKDTVKDTLIEKKLTELTADLAIDLGESEKTKLRSKKFQDNFQNERILSAVDLMDSIEDIQNAINNVSKLEYTKEFEATVKDRLKAVLKKVSSAEAIKKAEENAKNIETDIANDKANDQADPNTADNDDANADAIEGLHDDSSTDTTTKQEEEKDKFTNTKKIGKTSVLNTVGSQKYKAWLEDGAVKVGTSVEMFAGKSTGKVYNNPKAESERLKFIPGESEVTEDTYNYLPIKIEFGAGNFSFMSAKNSKNPKYKELFYEERKAIIDKLWAGETVTSKVAASSGGELQIDNDYSNNMVPENSILDLDQINGDISKVELVSTNKEGMVIDMDKTLDEDFGDTQITLKGEKDKNDNDMPHRGGIYIKVNRADGSKFMLRLNMGRVTELQGSIIADLLIGVTVPDIVGTKKAISYGTPMSELSPSIQDRIKESMPEAIELFDGNPKVSDLVSLYIHVSEKTEGLSSELYFDGAELKFAGKSVGVENKESGREELITFLTTVKRRQFNIKKWNELEGYKKFITSSESGALSTNAVVGDNKLFKSTSSRPITVWIDPTRTESALTVKKSTAKQKVAAQGELITKENQNARKARTENTGYVFDKYTGDKGTYYYRPGGNTMFFPGTKKKSEEAVAKKYASEVLEDDIKIDDIKISKDTKKEVSLPTKTKSALKIKKLSLRERGKASKNAKKETLEEKTIRENRSRKKLTILPTKTEDLTDGKEANLKCD